MRASTLALLGFCSPVLLLACSSSSEETTAPPATTTTGAGGAGGGATTRPEPVVNEQTTHDFVYDDAPFSAEVVTQLRTTEVLADLDVRSLAVAASGVYAGTATGLFRWSADNVAFELVEGTGTGPVVDMAELADGRLVAARETEVAVLSASGAAGELWPAAGATIASVATDGTRVFVGTDDGIGELDAAGLLATTATGFAARDLAVTGDVVWAATGAGLRRWDAAADVVLATLDGPEFLADDDVRAVTATPAGDGVLAATAEGLSRIEADGSAATIVLPGLESLPNGDLRAVAATADWQLTGHGIGATATGADHKDHYHSLRWLPDEEVTAVALEADGTRWIGTHAGVSRIGYAPSTLQGKADLFEPTIDRHFRADGIVADGVGFADPYVMENPTLWDRDNDGLWTQIQIAAWCFAYATTKDELYYDKARKAMDGMMLLHDLPGDTFEAAGLPRGFISRSYARDDETAIFEDKKTQSNWHLQAHGDHDYYWKDDTSSDEYAGHFFGTPIFYDLCAKDDAERKALADRVAVSLDYIIDNDYLLIDLDGERTTHGKWHELASAVDGIGPCLAANGYECAESYGGGGWLNSIEILGHLLAGWHMTGDPKYYDAYEYLAIEKRYGEMIPITDHLYTVVSTKNANHSDHELAILSYYTLLRYEPNADRRETWIKSVLDLYEWEREEHNPMQIAIIGSAVPDDVDTMGAIQTLRDMPIDWREWAVDNSHRLDAEIDPNLDRHGRPQFLTVFPYDEIRTMKWNGSPYVIADGGDGRAVQGPWPYLVAYWMMRYYGMIGAE